MTRRAFGASEADIQATIVAWCRLALPRHILVHIPNSPFIRARGFVTGAPDLLLVAPGGECAFIEVKTAHGKLRPEQEDFRDRCQRIGVKWACCRGVEDVETALASWGWLAERRLA
jgi:hypothetical protein